MAGSLTQRSPLPAGIAFGHLVALTTGLIFVTVLLGVSTRATGSGLACNANWPLCDGGLLNLLPASMPSAFEWLHRVVAGVTGVFILGTAIAAYLSRVADRRIRLAVVAGLVLLPVQILLGRETVVSFAPPVLALHYWTAMVMYGAFVAATVGAWRSRFRRRHVGLALGIAAVLVPVQATLGPPVVVRYSPPVQALQYAVVLTVFAALLLSTIAGWQLADGRALRVTLVGATAAAPFAVYFARQRIVHPELGGAHVVTTLGLFVAVVAAIWFLRSAGDETL